MIPEISVGILAAPKISIRLDGPYSANHGIDTHDSISITAGNGNEVSCQGLDMQELILTPLAPQCTFTLMDVTIGIGFHWQRREHQSFQGALKIICRDGMLHAINLIDAESYLRSVISSEMNAKAPEEFLKAHSVISRSWLLAQINPPMQLQRYTCSETESETIRWYDRDAHTLFHVCADDHCQRYQGCTKASTPQVGAAIEATCGEVLTFDGHLCDTRFSKCCGGVMEEFATCWQPVEVPYLRALSDNTTPNAVPDLTDATAMEQWVHERPDAFCANPPKEVLETVLNNYDLETSDFYRWHVEYSAEELADIIRTRSEMDYGSIISITPLHRGPSGRIDRLEIHGTRLRRIIGKELEIRRTLSRTHLYSSAFVITRLDYDSDGIPARWRIDGAGWGHGVGMCQIGAAVMAHKGYTYREILSHYFPGTELTVIY